MRAVNSNKCLQKKGAKKKARISPRFRCLHNGIILIVICFLVQI